MTTQTFMDNGTGQAVAMPLGAELRNKYGSDFKAVSRHPEFPDIFWPG
jgi:hypothetical protein